MSATPVGRRLGIVLLLSTCLILIHGRSDRKGYGSSLSVLHGLKVDVEE